MDGYFLNQLKWLGQFWIAQRRGDWVKISLSCPPGFFQVKCSCAPGFFQVKCSCAPGFFPGQMFLCSRFFPGQMFLCFRFFFRSNVAVNFKKTNLRKFYKKIRAASRLKSIFDILLIYFVQPKIFFSSKIYFAQPVVSKVFCAAGRFKSIFDF